MFVDVNKYLAENSISLLEGLGINHIRMYPIIPARGSRCTLTTR